MTIPRQLFRPPAPVPTSANRALLRALLSGQRDLISLLPKEAYEADIMVLGRTRRGIVLVNQPDLVRQVFQEDWTHFPKNDLFVGALQPLIGAGVFVATGRSWTRQRAMIDPAFSQLQIQTAFAHMDAAMSDAEAALDLCADDARSFAIDQVMSKLTMDVICRAIFSSTLDPDAATAIHAAFARFQRAVANVNVLRLLFGRPWAEVRQPRAALDAAGDIRQTIAEMVARHRDHMCDAKPPQDIASVIRTARDADNKPFSRGDIIDEIGVFVLAGHETTASAVTWALFLLSQQPDILARVRMEIDLATGHGPIDFAATKKLTLTRNVFREAMRLYPPGPFLPRIASTDSTLGGVAIPRGAMILVAPWLIHRHRKLWTNPDRFDPDRFAKDREDRIVPGSYIPFGLGPRMCIGAAFSTIEATLILARFVRRYDLTLTDPGSVKPHAQLTIGATGPMRARVRRRF